MSLGLRIALVYLLVINVVSLAMFGLDKHRARTRGWRIPESTLHLVGLAGGFPAGLLAMQLFRHKRRKKSFFLVYWGVALISGAMMWWLGGLLGFWEG